MNHFPKISESEWLVMKTLWANNRATANEIVIMLSESTSWKPKTIKTLLSRLVKKEAVGFEKQGREYLYYPKLGEDLCVKVESRSFLKRVFGGAVKPMFAALVENEELSKEDIEEIKQLLDKKMEK
jgi:BlaI family transcriptional regulator, penicillinase repressor